MDASSAFRRNFDRKVLLYQILDNERRAFLRRNIRDALDSHDSDLAKKKSNATGGQQNEGGGSRRTEWEPPSEITMKELIKTARPELRISSLRLRERDGNISRPSHNDGQPSWLTQSDEFIRSCQVRVVVLDKDRIIVHSDLRQARIVGHDNRNKKMTFDVQLESPLDINIEHLSAPTFTGRGPWTQLFDEENSLEIGIQHQDSQSAAEFLAHIEDEPVTNYLTTPASESIVRAKWSKPHDLPQNGELLPLFRCINTGSRIYLRHGLEVVMDWNQRSSPLAKHNRMARRRGEQTRQLPTPVSDDPKAGHTTNLKIKYMFRQGAWELRSVEMNHLKCIFCTHDYEQSSFERLQLHYVMNHDHFLFEVLDVEEDLKHVRINRRGDSKVTDTAVFAWNAPRRPFDTKAYLNGDTDWIDQPWQEVSGPHPPHPKKKRKANWVDQPWQEVSGPHPPRPKKKGKATVGQSGQASSIGKAKPQPLKIVPRKKYTEPENVPNLVPYARKKYMVPNIPGVQLYRTSTKQKLVPGTYISDSEDDIDDTWLKQRQRRDLKKLGEDDISLDFNELFNKHLDEERPMSDVFSRDAIVRFARTYVDILSEPGWKDKFEAKLEQLMSKKILRNKEVEYCMDLVEDAEKRKRSEKITNRKCIPTRPRSNGGAEGAGPVAPESQNNDYSGKKRMIWQNNAMRWADERGVPIPTAAAAGEEASATPSNRTGNPAKAPAEKMKPNTGPCVCGVRIQGMRGTIACANVKCPADGYHMACVGLEDLRPEGWKCGECSSASS